MAELAPRLIVFSDTTRSKVTLMLERFATLAREAAPDTVLFTLRDYHLSARARLALGAQLRALAERHEQAFGLADRADLAVALGARAVHLPEAGLVSTDLRTYLGSDVFVSRACHDPTSAKDSRADALLLSPIFEARKGRPALGLKAIAELRDHLARTSAPASVYALGAVDAGNAAACTVAGAAGVAVIGAALAADHRPLLDALEISRR